MSPTDLRILCLALGFTAVAMQGEETSPKEGHRRAVDFAKLIEDFCRISLPDAFGAANFNLAADSDNTEIDRAI